MEIIGYIASLLIGVSLGLIGGGGSILTVPVLVYLFQVDAVLATGYSLFIVGITALVGGIRAYIRKQVDVKTAVVFAIPSFIAVFATRRYLMPLIPEEIITVGSFAVTKEIGIMIFFSIIMIAAALSMILKKKEKKDLAAIPKRFNIPAIVLGRNSCWRVNRIGWSRWWIFDHSGIGAICPVAHENGCGYKFADNCGKIVDWFYWRPWRPTKHRLAIFVDCFRNRHRWYFCGVLFGKIYKWKEFKGWFWLVCFSHGHLHYSERVIFLNQNRLDRYENRADLYRMFGARRLLY